MEKLLSILYIIDGNYDYILNSIRTLDIAAKGINYEILIICNHFKENGPNDLKKRKIRVIESGANFSYHKLATLGTSYAKGNTILFTNPNILFAPLSLTKMFFFLKKRKNIGIIGPQILTPKNEIVKSIFIQQDNFIKKRGTSSLLELGADFTKDQKAFALSSRCIMMRKNVFFRVEGFDQYLSDCFADIDIGYKMSKIGFKAYFFPSAKVMDESTSLDNDINYNDKWIDMKRFNFFKKNIGSKKAFIYELYLRVNKRENLVLFILVISTILNLYKINPLTLSMGDIGRDYLAARDMLLTGNIPLVGIKSSVVWLHQGPLSVYFIGLSFLVSKFNPYSPAILYSIFGVITTLLVYRIGRKIFNTNIGLLSALFYATSPLIIVNTRMPYHTSPIPFFAAIFFILLYGIATKRKNIFLTAFFFGILLQFELSNAVLFGMFAILYFVFKPKIKKKDLTLSFTGFLSGVLPFILYDISNGFVYSIKFPLWVANRFRVFLMGGAFQESTLITNKSALYAIYQQGAGIIFPASILVVILIILLLVTALLNIANLHRKTLKKKGIIIIFLWLFVPLAGFIIHSTPGTAYFPLLFIPLSIIIAFGIDYWARRFKIIYLLFFLICFINAFLTIKNDYFLFSKSSAYTLPPESYGFGFSMDIPQNVAKAIVDNSRNRPFHLASESNTFQLENFSYLIWYQGGKIDEKSQLIYKIYSLTTQSMPEEKIIYTDKYLKVTVNEN